MSKADFEKRAEELREKLDTARQYGWSDGEIMFVTKLMELNLKLADNAS